MTTEAATNAILREWHKHAVWDYRIVRYKHDEGFGLHEVYYDKDGQPWGMTEDAASFVCDVEEGVEGIVSSLLMALGDARQRPILDVPDKWPGRVPPEEYPH